MKTPEDETRDKLNKIIRSTLGEDYIKINIVSVEIKEELSCNKTAVLCTFSLSGDETMVSIKGDGQGIVDALYGAFVNKI